MLSFIYRISHDFEQEHGISPNQLYINYTHLECLKSELSNPDDIDSIVQLLGMEIILRDGTVYPLVSWSDEPWKHGMIT